MSYLEGEYKDDCLEGLARILWKDGTWSEGFFKGGVLHGFARRFDADKQLTFIGMYRWAYLQKFQVLFWFCPTGMGNLLGLAGSYIVGEVPLSAGLTRTGSLQAWQGIFHM